MAFNLTDFSEIVRTLSPSRFARFMEGVLDIERGYRPGEFAVSKSVDTFSDLGFSFLEYVKSDISGWGYLRTEISEFIITHHVPSFIADAKYIDILSRDLKEIYNSEAFKERNRRFQNPYYTPVATYYGTNKDYGPFRRSDPEAWQSALQDAAVTCIDPYSIAAYPGAEEVLLDILNQPDGIVVEVSEAGVSIRPFVATDILVGTGMSNAYVLNVDATPLVASRIESLEGLKDTLTLAPDERHIESFLIAHPHILLGDKYSEFRTQVTIAPSGERPDFFLERLDGLWEILELKRPTPAKLWVEPPAGPSQIAQYLEESLKQCLKYLRLLDRVDIRNRLLRQGIRIEQPRVTLLIGKQQYPQSVVDIVRSAYDARITLLSFAELFENCKHQAAITLAQMNSLAMQRQKVKGEV